MRLLSYVCTVLCLGASEAAAQNNCVPAILRLRFISASDLSPELRAAAADTLCRTARVHPVGDSMTTRELIVLASPPAQVRIQGVKAARDRLRPAVSLTARSLLLRPRGLRGAPEALGTLEQFFGNLPRSPQLDSLVSRLGRGLEVVESRDWTVSTDSGRTVSMEEGVYLVRASVASPTGFQRDDWGYALIVTADPRRSGDVRIRGIASGPNIPPGYMDGRPPRPEMSFDLYVPPSLLMGALSAPDSKGIRMLIVFSAESQPFLDFIP
jgi:hypothetical protein